MKETINALDIITIIIASVALIVSIISVIKQFFWKSFSFNGCLIQYLSATGAMESFNFEYSVANTGNIILIIKELLCDPVEPPINYISPIIKPDKIPAILKPGQMQMVHFNIPALLFKSAAENVFKIKITFTIVSPKGKIYNVSHFIQPEMGGLDIEKSAWVPFSLSQKRDGINKKPTKSLLKYLMR